MGIIQKLFGKRPAPAVAPALAPSASVEDIRNDPNLIRVFDKYGRELFITKDEWRKSVLPDHLKKHWNDAQQLYDAVVGALNDGLHADLVAAAQQLFKIDPDRPRATCVLGIVLQKLARLDEAETVYRDFLAQHGEDGYVLTNLAKVLADRDKHEEAEATLWRGLKRDPNQENGLGWYGALHFERGGADARLAAMQRVAELPSSWRAQLWMARAALESKDLARALALYRQGLERASRPHPSDMLVQISGDLGNAGYLQEAIEIVEPEFDPPVHGLYVGNNLIKAHLDLKQEVEAKRVLDALFALRRADYGETLAYWETEIAKARVSAQPAPAAPLAMQLLLIEGPIWLNKESPLAQIFPSKKDATASVAFFGGTVESASPKQEMEHQLADVRGRMCRALPIFLAEQVHFGTSAGTRSMVPWIDGDQSGFALIGVPWSDEEAVKQCAGSDYVVLSHLDVKSADWTVDVRLVRCSDATCLGVLSESFPMTNPEESLLRLGRQIRDLLARVAPVRAQPVPPAYSVPSVANISYYLLRLEQLLAVRCAAMRGEDDNTLSGEREIVAGTLQLCLDEPRSVNCRILFAQTLHYMKRVRPHVNDEFEERTSLLQREHPLPEPAHRLVKAVIDEAMAPSSR